MRTVHNLKTLPGYFKEVMEGNKTFEIRKDDRGFKVGDVLLLKEWREGSEIDRIGIGVYTGREVPVYVSYIFTGGFYGVKEGYCVMAIKLVE